MLPAPRDPHAPEAVPPDPPPAPPPEPPPLEPQLTGLLRSAGAQAVHAVDGVRGDVLAEVGLADGDDVHALVQLARAAGAVGRGRGEWLEDIVVTLGRTVHVLRECDGVVLHVRLDPARGDIGAVRRGLAADSLLRATVAAGRAASAAAAEPAGTDGPPRGGAAGPAAQVSGPTPRPRPATGAPSARHAARPRPSDANVWPYSLPAPSQAAPSHAAPSPTRRPAGPRPADQRGAGAAPPGPAPAPPPGAPAMRQPQPRRALQGPSATTAGQGRPVPQQQSGSQPIPRSIPRSVPQLGPRSGPQSGPRPSPQPRPERLQDPPPVPLPRPAIGPGPDGRVPALVAVDGGSPVTASGALAVLALPPVAALPRRRPAAAVPAGPSGRALATPPVLRQPWASDVDTMGRLLAQLHRMS